MWVPVSFEAIQIYMEFQATQGYIVGPPPRAPPREPPHRPRSKRKGRRRGEEERGREWRGRHEFGKGKSCRAEAKSAQKESPISTGMDTISPILPKVNRNFTIHLLFFPGEILSQQNFFPLGEQN